MTCEVKCPHIHTSSGMETWTSLSVWVSGTELGISPQLHTSAREFPVAATMQRGQSCSTSIMISFSQKYSNKICTNKYFKQVWVIERRIPEAAFLFLCIQVAGNASSLGCISVWVYKHTQSHWEGNVSLMFLDLCHLFNHAFFEYLEVSNQHAPGPQDRGMPCLRVLQYIMWRELLSLSELGFISRTLLLS